MHNSSTELVQCSYHSSYHFYFKTIRETEARILQELVPYGLLARSKLLSSDLDWDSMRDQVACSCSVPPVPSAVPPSTALPATLSLHLHLLQRGWGSLAKVSTGSSGRFVVFSRRPDSKFRPLIAKGCQPLRSIVRQSVSK